MQVTFKIEYQTVWGESLALVLNDRKYPMEWGEGGVWSVTVKDCTAAALKDYTYVVMREGLIWRTEWKHHSSKMAREISDKWIDCPIPGCPFPREHQAAKFDRPGFRGAGTAIPVFSLRTESDFGIGEFKDLRPLVDWAAATGQCIIQLLPVNDTTRKGEWKDSYPYSPISSFALHPLYINLQALGIRETVAFKKEQAELNALEELDYPRVFQAKMKYIRKAFKTRGARDMDTPGFKKFVLENEYWLEEYAQFCAKRDSLEPEYYRWMQWHLDKQFAAEVKYARGRGVSLKGDLPIGVSSDSAEAYWHPELFNLDSTAGAPPDYFSKDGQNWGFPTYNWEEMAKDDFAWWKARLRKMSQYFDAFRIDHILGFFRIWEIPAGIRSGLAGHFNPALPYSPEEIYNMHLPIDGLFHEDPRHPGMYQPLINSASQNLPQWQQERFGALYNDFFYHRHDEFWRRNAERKLPELLGATGMLACGEDLGMVPDCVPGVMDHERILSLRMRGMENEGPWKQLSVCATSSHDMETLRMQCNHDPEPWEVRNMLWEFLASPSMLAIFPLQDWVALDKRFRRADRNVERINYPADSDNHWKFRIHFNLQDLMQESELNVAVTGLLKDSSRFVKETAE
ncbi:MAG: 4-alpha-glucanotransferase [Candidatus Cryptobacteroides sp.]|nr:4-alpha-glucanotransferase [Bacteroidales bacterium]MDY6157706.1 4-alpha-glucanotransferase [Candidatus Cryptobacteroides sp.]